MGPEPIGFVCGERTYLGTSKMPDLQLKVMFSQAIGLKWSIWRWALTPVWYDRDVLIKKKKVHMQEKAVNTPWENAHL